MKVQLWTIFAAVYLNFADAAKLSNKYLPPSFASSSGGHGSFLQGPRPATVLAARPSNQYLESQSSNVHPYGVSGTGASLHTSHGARFGGGAAAASPSHRYGHNSAAVKIPILRNEYTNDGSGNYNFGFETGNGIRRDETGHFAGDWPHGSLDVMGSYSYTGDDGHVYTVNYKADSNGFHAEGDHLPTAPPIPKEIQESLALHHSGRGGAATVHAHFGGGHAASSPSIQYLPPQHQQQRQPQGYHYGRRHY